VRRPGDGIEAATLRRAARAITGVLATLALVCGPLSTAPAAQARPHEARKHRIEPHKAPAPPPNSLPGIDVSHHQNAIDWTQVAGSGIRFAIAKATEGTGYIDPLFSTNRADAMAAGITFGAYHFARPDLHPFDPVPEADHFVDTAQLAPGNILPVLDLERSGNLSPAELTDWVLQWLGRVTERTGVHPIVYTSPNGWKDRMADTTAIADAGYTVLWVAHWGVAAPTLPANDWQGNGWTIWQYSNCGHVPGITGCVDLDWFDGLDFAPIIIPSPDTVAPIATIATPSGVVGPVTVSFDEIVRGVSDDSLSLKLASSGVPVDATISCASKAGDQVNCATGKLIVAVLEANEPLVPGQSYQVVVNPAGTIAPIVDRGGNPASSTQADFAAPTLVEQASAAIRYGWRTASSKDAFGKSYVTDHLSGSTASFAFKGKSVTWYTVAGPAQGKASVWIDGHPKGTFNQYAPSTTFKVARSFRHLAVGDHTITIRVLGTEGAKAGTDTQVAVDAIEAGGKVVWSPGLTFGWGKAKNAAASRGDVAVSDLAGSTATFAFYGSGVDWGTARGRHQGRAQIYVDGVLRKTVDNYAGSPGVVVRSITGLTPGLHELRIVVVGEARPAADGTQISIDTFRVIA
jgi:GH25 family lysozyme M1 (1,4-beta-N-acetylmuramidase)